MAITSGFFNAQVDEFGVADRLYDAEQMSSIFDGIIRDGVFAFIGDKFKVTVGGGNAVNIGTGRAWFDHVWILNDTLHPLTVPAAEVVLDRIDAVVFDIDRNIGVRNGGISVIKGTPSSGPSRPAMIRQEERNTYPIAYIRRVAGRSLTQADITVVVGTGETPFVTGPIETIGVDLFVDSMRSQWDLWFQETSISSGLEFQEWMTDKKFEFDDWFATIKDTMSGDVEANIVEMIVDLREKFGILEREYSIYQDLESSYSTGSTKDYIMDSDGRVIEGSIIYQLRGE